MPDILHKLTERQGQVVMLRYGEELTERRIAERLKLSERRVRYIIHAARKRLRPLNVTLPRPTHGRHRTSQASQAGDRGMNLDAI